MGCNTSKESVQPAVDEAKEGDSVKNGDISKPAEDSATKEESSDKEKEKEDVEDEKEKEEAAATKIQAVFRGHHARKSLKVSETTSGPTKTEEAPSEPTEAQLQEEFPPGDKELCHAVTKIQATFRGHMSRKEQTTAAVKSAVESATAKIEEKMSLHSSLLPVHCIVYTSCVCHDDLFLTLFSVFIRLLQHSTIY
ncbi:chemotaxis regulatory protein ChePep isoform X2 [Linepithema humile]|uniref:chemotaxis regulatory protein ChePep isoform X2 n=1 Tax=Linepithema humile TaxID=83485 RepID=UPI00351ECE18